MLAIRMQRTGRKGHPMFRLVVQDSRRSPSRGKIVTQLGHYDPHQKTLVVEKDKAVFFLEHGAHPSDRVARLLKSEGINLPKWVHLQENNPRAVKNINKLRRNRPAGAEVEKTETKPATPVTEEEAPAEETVVPTETEVSEKLPEDKPIEPTAETEADTTEKS